MHYYGLIKTNFLEVNPLGIITAICVSWAIKLLIYIQNFSDPSLLNYVVKMQSSLIILYNSIILCCILLCYFIENTSEAISLENKKKYTGILNIKIFV